MTLNYHYLIQMATIAIVLTQTVSVLEKISLALVHAI